MTGDKHERVILFLLGEKSVVLSLKFVKTEAAGDTLRGHTGHSLTVSDLTNFEIFARQKLIKKEISQFLPKKFYIIYPVVAHEEFINRK